MHPFEKAGLGVAPFRCVGVYKNAYQACADAPIQAAGSCDFCGTCIMYEYKILSSDGRGFKVGCDCVAKTGGEGLVEGVRTERLKLARTQRSDKRAEQSKQYAEARETRRLAEFTARHADFVSAHPDVAAALESITDEAGFMADMRDNVRRWGSLTPNMLTAVQGSLARIASREVEKANNHHVGIVGKRHTGEFTIVAFTDRPGFAYNTRSYWYLLKSGDCVFTYRGSCRLGAIGETFKATFTVKDHAEYKGTPQTVLARPKFAEETVAA